GVGAGGRQARDRGGDQPVGADFQGAVVVAVAVDLDGDAVEGRVGAAVVAAVAVEVVEGPAADVAGAGQAVDDVAARRAAAGDQVEAGPGGEAVVAGEDVVEEALRQPVDGGEGDGAVVPRPPAEGQALVADGDEGGPGRGGQAGATHLGPRV